MTLAAAARAGPRDNFVSPPVYRAAVPRPSALMDGIVVALTMAAVLAIGTLSSEALNFFKIHYISAGGHFYEKLHPATYLTFAAFLTLLFRRADPIGELDRIVAPAKLLLVLFFACALLILQCIALDRPFTGVIDTFLLPGLLGIIIWSLTPRQRRPLALVIHAVIWLNVALAFYEFFFKHRLIPITIGKLVVLGDWRSTALLGHPLTAAGIVAMYSMAMILREKSEAWKLWTLPVVAVTICSLMVFGGRTSLVSMSVLFVGLGVVNFVRLVRGDRFSLLSVILAAAIVMLAAAAIAVVLGTGVFDKMFLRFSSDNGSAHTRIASMQLLTMFDWKELLLGTTSLRSTALQNMMGLQYGIEDFWIACTIQYGLVQTALITAGLGCFFFELLKRSQPAARATILFLCVVAASSVSFSSKTIALGAYVALIGILLGRRQPAAARAGYALRRAGRGFAPALAAG